MKKAIVLIMAALVTLSLLAAPADAVSTGRRRQTHVTTCRILYAQNGNILSYPCLSLNVHDTLQNRIEARVLTIDSKANVQIRVDWIHLYRNGELHKSTDGTGWEWAEIVHSTNWGACTLAGNVGKFRAVVRIQARKFGNAAGPWLKYDTPVWQASGGWC